MIAIEPGCRRAGACGEPHRAARRLRGGRGQPLPGAVRVGRQPGPVYRCSPSEMVIARGEEEPIRHGRLTGKHQVAPLGTGGRSRLHRASGGLPAAATSRSGVASGSSGEVAASGRSRSYEALAEVTHERPLSARADSRADADGSGSYAPPSELPLLLQEASKKEISYSDFLEEVLSRGSSPPSTSGTRRCRPAMARFPFQKTLESFDFKLQPSLEPKVIQELATCRFIADADNVLLLGPPGVGKTHLAVGLWA